MVKEEKEVRMAKQKVHLIPHSIGKNTVTLCHTCKTVIDIGEWVLLAAKTGGSEDCFELDISIYKYHNRPCPNKGCHGKITAPWRFQSEENAQQYADAYELPEVQRSKQTQAGSKSVH